MVRQKNLAPAAVPRFGVSFWLFLLVAFGLGIGAGWFFFRPAAAPPPMIESFLPGAAAPNPASAQTPVSAMQALPDVSHLPPAEAARTLGNWSYDHQDWTAASEHYQQALAAGADTPDVHTDLGNCFRFLGQPERALEQYQIAQKQDPRHENSLFNQISLYSDYLHDKERAAAAARDFLARFPQSPQADAARQLSLQAR
jgi:Tetratricopeptide repeat